MQMYKGDATRANIYYITFAFWSERKISQLLTPVNSPHIGLSLCPLCMSVCIYISLCLYVSLYVCIRYTVSLYVCLCLP